MQKSTYIYLTFCKRKHTKSIKRKLKILNRAMQKCEITPDFNYNNLLL